MKLTITTNDGEAFPVEVADDIEVENLVALAQVEAPSLSRVDAPNLRLLHKGRDLLTLTGDNLKRSASELGIRDNDVLMVVSAAAVGRSNAVKSERIKAGSSSTSTLPNIDFASIQVPSSSSSNPRRRGPPAGLDVDKFIEEEISKLKAAVAQDRSGVRAQLMQNNPELLEGIEAGDDQRIRTFLKGRMEARLAEQSKQLRLLQSDPLDAEAQRLIEQLIQQKNIDQQMEDAIEHVPEMFAHVTMLYIDCRVNEHPIKAFVDSGAQSTIMSAGCAERCNVSRLIDRRFSGIARGVGTQKVLGKIHMAQMEIAGHFFPVSFTVLEQQNMDVLFGLDMLKRHQCVIDMEKNVLRIGTTATETPFLPESQLPKHDLEGDEQNPKDPGLDAGKVGRLVEMGFDESRAVAALRDCAGDVDSAAARLAEQRQQRPPPAN